MPPRGKRRTRTSGGQGVPQRTRARQANSGERPQIQIQEESLQSWNESVNILLYGDSGVGKTTTAGGAATSGRKAVFMSTEKGVVSAKRTGSIAGLYRTPSWDHVEAALDKADAELGADDWLISDSITRMQVLLMRWILEEEHEARDADLDTLQLQHYPKWWNMYMRFIDRMIDAPYNTILVAQAMHLEDVEGEPIIVPAIMGSSKDPMRLSNYCCAQSDCVFYLGIAKPKTKRDEPVRRILTEAYPPFFAKNRFSGTLPKRVDIDEGEYDTMDWIINQIQADDTEPAAE